MSTNPENLRSDDGIGHRYNPTAPAPGPGPKLRTFEDGKAEGILEAVKILDLFKRNPHAHWVRVNQEQPGVLHPVCVDLCKYKGKRPCQSRGPKCEGMSNPINSKHEAGIVEFILCSLPYPAKNPLAMLLPGWEIQGDKPALSDKI